jgi:hypothetical protein
MRRSLLHSLVANTSFIIPHWEHKEKRKTQNDPKGGEKIKSSVQIIVQRLTEETQACKMKKRNGSTGTKTAHRDKNDIVICPKSRRLTGNRQSPLALWWRNMV